MDPLTCMIAALWFEGWQLYNEPDAIHAIADVIQTRVEGTRYPNDVCRVVYERKQFSFTHDGKPDTPNPQGAIDAIAYDVVTDIAERSMEGEFLGLTSTHYHTINIKPMWVNAYQFDGIIGTHKFYTNETKWK